MLGLWIQTRVIVVQLVILTLLGCSLACLASPSAIVPSDAMTITLGGLSVGSATSSGQTSSNAQRPPQVALDVEEYPVASHGLELEQVHVFVRHGKQGI